MRWYEQRFTNFFKRWKKGYLYTKNGESHYGSVKKLDLNQDFEESTILFAPLGAEEKKAKEVKVPLRDIVYFRASDGPIFNVEKYISIFQMQQKSRAEAEAPKKADTDKELVCVAFGLEFYATPKTAKLLKSDLKELIRARLKDTPLVTVKEERSLELTPTFNTLVQRVKSRFKRK